MRETMPTKYQTWFSCMPHQFFEQFLFIITYLCLKTKEATPSTQDTHMHTLTVQ